MHWIQQCFNSMDNAGIEVSCMTTVCLRTIVIAFLQSKFRIHVALLNTLVLKIQRVHGLARLTMLMKFLYQVDA